MRLKYLDLEWKKDMIGGQDISGLREEILGKMLKHFEKMGGQQSEGEFWNRYGDKKHISMLPVWPHLE